MRWKRVCVWSMPVSKTRKDFWEGRWVLWAVLHLFGWKCLGLAPLWSYYCIWEFVFLFSQRARIRIWNIGTMKLKCKVSLMAQIFDGGWGMLSLLDLWIIHQTRRHRHAHYQQGSQLEHLERGIAKQLDNIGTIDLEHRITSWHGWVSRRSCCCSSSSDPTSEPPPPTWGTWRRPRDGPPTSADLGSSLGGWGCPWWIPTGECLVVLQESARVLVRGLHHFSRYFHAAHRCQYAFLPCLLFFEVP